MKQLLFLFTISILLFTACKGKNEKKTDSTTNETTKDNNEDNSGKDPVLDLDLSTLKDEAGFLKAWEDFTTARMADEKKRNEDKSYKGYYLEYTNKYTALLKATTAFSQTIQPASAAVAFNEKVSAIQAKMY